MNAADMVLVERYVDYTDGKIHYDKENFLWWKPAYRKYNRTIFPIICLLSVSLPFSLRTILQYWYGRKQWRLYI